MRIRINDIYYPVTEKFHAEVLAPYPHLAESHYASLEALQKKLLDLSYARSRFMAPEPDAPMAPGGTLTIAEEQELEAITHVMNVHHAVNFLRGKSHEEFGFSGVDQVHGNIHRLECGCVHHKVFDHHRRHEPDNIIHHHRTVKTCDAHKGKN